MWRSILLLTAGLTLGAQSADPDAKPIEDYQNRVAAYVKLHNKARSSVGTLKPTASPERIANHEKQVAHKIREAREHVLQGNIFTPEIAAAFQRRIRKAMAGGDATTVHQSLRRGEPVAIQLRVNRTYPEGVPLQTTPPSLLLNLPQIPAELEYRVVSGALVLRDVSANLIVDFIPNAIP